MTEEFDLPALIGSRICHDLISPIGAIGNGVELLSMAQDGDRGEMDLIRESVENASARIRFFRIAYGAASVEHSTSRSEVCGILETLARSGRHSYVWAPSSDLPRQEVKIALLAIQCLEQAMPYGGHIHVEQHGGHWTINGETGTLRIDRTAWEMVAAPPTIVGRVSAAQVQFVLLPKAAQDVGRKISLDFGATSLMIRF